jgi:hypothetical protein
MVNSNSTNLLWINSSGFNAPRDRLKQRREVMQKVAWRRKQQPKQHHHNSVQLPLFILDDLPEKTPSQKHKQTPNESDALDKNCFAKTKTLDSNIVESADVYLNTSLTCLRVCATKHPFIST